MASRSRLGRFARLAAVGALVALALPASVSATPSLDSCASQRSIIYSASVPDGMRTAGTKDVQWRTTFTELGTGNVIVDDSIVNTVTFDSAAPTYAGNVLIRLFRSTAILKNGDVVIVPAINPAQPALMHVQVSWVTSEPFFTGPFVIEFRYQTSPHHWSAWYGTSAGPETSLCPETTKAIWKRQYGWQEG